MKRRAIAIALVLAACGGSEPPRAEQAVAPARPPLEPHIPIEVEIDPHRSGAALRLDVRATGFGVREGAAFEDPARWTITAHQDDAPLQRLANGSTEISRLEAKGGRWDTVVSFNLTFEAASEGEVKVALTAPGGKRVVHTIDPSLLADEGAVADAGPTGVEPDAGGDAKAAAEPVEDDRPKKKRGKKKRKKKL